MPVVYLPAMDEETRGKFQEAQRQVANATLYGGLKLETERPNGDKPRLIIRRTGKRAEDLQPIIQAVGILQEELDAGRATISKGGRIVEAQVRRFHNYPVNYMTPSQEEQFYLEIKELNIAMSRRDCSFESFLDEEAQVFFRYSVADHADRREEILDRIHRVINHVHSGRAVRIEMDGNSVMLMPRWRLEQKLEDQPEPVMTTSSAR